MPELPDVETLRRYLAATSLHSRIARIDLKAPRMLYAVSRRELRAGLTGSSFERTARHGKNLFVALSQGNWLLLHFGMTGRLAYLDDAERPPPHTGLLIGFANGDRLACVWLRKLGKIGLVESPRAFCRERGLGPDAYALPLTEFRDLLAERRGSVKSALMDQHFIAGIGNVYSDEILFQAGIHPRASANRLSRRETATLHRALRHVLRIAIERRADPERLPDTWLLRRRTPGGRCPRCGGALRRIAIAGRTAYLCPKCQRRAR